MLTDTAIRSAKPGDKPKKLSDEKGLFLQVTPTGAKLWRIKYRYQGRENLLSLGPYPEVSLKDARQRRDAIRQQLAAGIDPSAARKAAKISASGADTFETLAREWHTRQKPTWSEGHAHTTLRNLERDVFPWIGSRPTKDIAAPELLSVLRRIESRGAVKTAHRVVQICGQVFRYAIATGRADRDISADLRGALAPPEKTRYPAVTTPKEAADLLRAIDCYKGTFVVRCALRIAPLAFVRPGELRKAEWSEIDLDAALWRIPANRMKGRVEHMIPLSRQTLAVLLELQPLTGNGRYVFPSETDRRQPLSENALNGALRRLGYDKSEMTAHGFRAMASSLLHEMGWDSDVIERQLAHAEANKTKAAYCRTERMAERTRMMQSWADCLDQLKTGATILSFARRA